MHDVPEAQVMDVVRHMLLTTFPAGKEWDPMSEQQIYFIMQGAQSGNHMAGAFL
jgi:hypothetical protein